VGTCCGVGGQSSNPHPIPRLPLPKKPPNILYYLLNIILPLHSNLGRSKKNGQARPSPFVDMTRVMWDGDCWTTLSIFPYCTFLQSRRHRCRFSAQYVAALGCHRSAICSKGEADRLRDEGEVGVGLETRAVVYFIEKGVCFFLRVSVEGRGGEYRLAYSLFSLIF